MHSHNTLNAQAKFEGSTVSEISISLDGADAVGTSGEQYARTIREVIGATYATVKVRDAIEQLYLTNEIDSIEVEATDRGGSRVALRFLVKRKAKAKRVSIQIPSTTDSSISEQELLFKLNLLDPGAAVTEAALQNNADLILEYLRERGYVRATVTYTHKPLENPNDVAVAFQVTPGQPAKVDTVKVAIDGFNSEKLVKSLKLKPGEVFTRDLLSGDAERVRTALLKEGFLAPSLEQPRAVYDSETNTMAIEFAGKAGPPVEVIVETEEGKKQLSSRTKRRLLPVAREGTLDFAAIIEGERRLETHYQEQGYFFADVTAVCAVEPVTPAGTPPPVATTANETNCSTLSSSDFTDRKAVVKYRVDLDRRLKLVDIRLQGTTLFTIPEIQAALDTQRANILGIIPLFGYGRGYTSERILEQDSATIRSFMRELGYRDATVRVNRGVSLDGENLIITFIVEQGEPSTVSNVEITGNKEFTTDVLMAQLPPLEGVNFSRAKVRNGQRKLAEFYSKAGYYDANVEFSVDEIDPAEKKFKIVYTIRNEGKPVYINRILVSGVQRTRERAIRRALTLREGELLTAANVYLSEQNLYSSDAFSNVEIKPQPAGDRPDGARLTDIMVNVVEQAPRILTYGGGASTDLGANGFADLRHFNLFGNLWQGGVRIRWSQRQQIVGFDFVNPRFLRDGKDRFAPLTISAQYQRDSTVTRFFRSAFDRGTFGIVQRVDANGNPIDEFGVQTGAPTLNRLTLTAETNRTLSKKDRSVVFFKYKFEDVRLFNIESLLIKELLIPDSRIRTSGFGATFVRDTREHCSSRYSILDIIAKGEALEPCRYNASDPTRGDYMTAEYNISVPALGANIGFHKFQASYNVFRTFPRFRNTTLAARAILGLAQVFHERNRFAAPDFPGLEGILPISERFFAGGSNTLRGFEFESAGPRVVVAPQGTFLDQNGEPVVLSPFTIPFGGNALAVVNLEARIPLNTTIRIVPFYDGGNVFRRIGDIFNPPDVPANDVFQQNLRVLWSHTVGLGIRVKTPVGGELGVDYGYLLNPPTFIVPQNMGPNVNLKLSPSKIHFRFSQAF